MNRHIRVTQEAGLNSLEKAAKGVTRANPLGGGDEEAAGAGGGVADKVAWFGGGEFHHEPDDMGGVRNCPFCPAMAILPSMNS